MNPDFNKTNGLLPAIIQDAISQQVLMLGYMNEEALEKTKADGRVTFFSRSKNRLWTKGETSGNYLKVQEIKMDCDNDTLLISALPLGPVCHTGTQSCFGETDAKGFLYKLEQTIADRITADDPDSYVSTLLKRGINKVAQKVGEEAVELVIEAKDNNDDLFKNEAADLLFHFLMLLKAKGFGLEDIEKVLAARQK
ncbi:bifunctional phosphoribosyl-AMP cyclohydrolase/phosphoribosyl-ATP diphosphatase HisIE [Flavobacterium psychrotrophum]|uniref:bifunctional phosphoribosyl-AMP cyclohydrolase/phosphoribosyl-ATP diphosphatase HisIE n=1 Tax=Flavobacterium psychrotrophum TaxID=2294119 RepID=UPI000E31BECC|nr:bifunctional phosphoribosyl-AMP cyclohydrolase/phosphoribosyl-ATP diphosphatase HisIE [Flavobacterium psychrotrophum]